MQKFNNKFGYFECLTSWLLGSKKKKLKKSFTADYINWQHDWVQKKDLRGRGSPISKKLYLQIQKNVPQEKIVKFEYLIIYST